MSKAKTPETIRGLAQARFSGEFRVVSIREIPDYGAALRVRFNVQGSTVYADLVQWGEARAVYNALERACPAGSVLRGSLSYDKDGEPALDSEGKPRTTQAGEPIINRRAYPLGKLSVVHKTWTLGDALGLPPVESVGQSSEPVV